MDPELWPQQPHPEPAGPHFHDEISQLAGLRTVRHGLRTWLPDIGADAGAFVLEHVLLVVDELVSNGLRHGGAPVQVHAVRTAEGLLVDVSDGDPRHGPDPAADRDPALGGMGLHIVAHLTIDRGWTVTDGRKHVWVRMSTG